MVACKRNLDENFLAAVAIIILGPFNIQVSALRAGRGDRLAAAELGPVARRRFLVECWRALNAGAIAGAAAKAKEDQPEAWCLSLGRRALGRPAVLFGKGSLSRRARNSSRRVGKKAQNHNSQCCRFQPVTWLNVTLFKRPMRNFFGSSPLYSVCGGHVCFGHDIVRMMYVISKFKYTHTYVCMYARTHACKCM